jgi:hypothetical protein
MFASLLRQKVTLICHLSFSTLKLNPTTAFISNWLQRVNSSAHASASLFDGLAFEGFDLGVGGGLFGGGGVRPWLVVGDCELPLS